MFVDSCIGVWLSYETTASVMSHSAGQGGAPDQCNDHNYSSPPWTLEQSPARDTQQTSRHCYVIHPSLRHCHCPAEVKTVDMCCAVWR